MTRGVEYFDVVLLMAMRAKQHEIFHRTKSNDIILNYLLIISFYCTIVQCNGETYPLFMLRLISMIYITYIYHSIYRFRLWLETQFFEIAFVSLMLVLYFSLTIVRKSLGFQLDNILILSANNSCLWM